MLRYFHTDSLKLAVSLTVFPHADILFPNLPVEPRTQHRRSSITGYPKKGLFVMAKKLPAIRKRAASRNWIAYLCEALVTSGVMPTWEAATYLNENLFGEKPNPRLLGPSNPHDVTSQFLRRLYQPIVEAASRDAHLPSPCMLHLFTDISLTGNSAVLVVLFPGQNRPPQLLMLDAARAWDLVFPDAESFNAWAEDRYRRVVNALRSAAVDFHDDLLTSAV